MERFIGNIDAKADVKGRVFVPASFRKILGAAGDSRIILRKDVYQNCLVLYPATVWNQELDELRSRLNKYDEAQQRLFRQFVSKTEVLEMDSSGRILIPKRYFQECNMGSEVRFVGMDNTIEIWGRDQLEESLMDTETFRNSVKDLLG